MVFLSSWHTCILHFYNWKDSMNNLARKIWIVLGIALIMTIGIGFAKINQRFAPSHHLIDYSCNCVVNCMDDRASTAVKKYMQKKYGVTHVDPITEAGPNKILAENQDRPIIENIKKRIRISRDYHDAKVVAIVAHDDCAGNKAPKEEQVIHLRKAKKVVENFDLNMTIILLWLDDDFETVHEIN